jgi:hypothetical protein
MTTQIPQTRTEVPRNPTQPTYDRQPAGDRQPTVIRRTFTETKNGFKTSEFYVMVLFVAGVLLSSYADADSLARERGWFIAGLAVAAYIVSRGLAKLGTREPHDEHDNH